MRDTPSQRNNNAQQVIGYDPPNPPILPTFQQLVGGSRIVDSVYCNQYGPRGFDGGIVFSLISRAFVMTDARGPGGPDDKATDEAALSARLRHLGERLGQQQASRPPEHDGGAQTANRSGIAQGLRLSTELVAGVVVGGVIGWTLDRVLGISPWGFIVFLLLGFAAGILNLMRAAGLVAERDVRGKQ